MSLLTRYLISRISLVTLFTLLALVALFSFFDIINEASDLGKGSYTLGIMLVVAGIFVPLILLYTLWCYTRMWGRLTNKTIEANPHGLY